MDGHMVYHACSQAGSGLKMALNCRDGSIEILWKGGGGGVLRCGVVSVMLTTHPPWRLESQLFTFIIIVVSSCHYSKYCITFCF